MYRSLRSENLPSVRDLSLSTEIGRGRGVGFMLGQCLSGGVFRWLMLACGDDIDKSIQVGDVALFYSRVFVASASFIFKFFVTSCYSNFYFDVTNDCCCFCDSNFKYYK